MAHQYLAESCQEFPELCTPRIPFDVEGIPTTTSDEQVSSQFIPFIL